MEGILETLENAISAQRESIEGHHDAITRHQEAILKQQGSLKALEDQLTTLKNVEVQKVEVTVTEEQSQEMLIEPDPVNEALSNRVILSKILRDVDNKTVMSSRFVARAWNNAALEIFHKPPAKGEKSRHLILNNLFKSSEFSRQMQKLDARLTKRIRFYEEHNNCKCGLLECDDIEDCSDEDCECENIKVCEWCIVTRDKLNAFFRQFSVNIQIMDIPHLLSRTFLKAILNRCFNLRALYFYHGDEEDGENCQIGTQFKLDPLPKQLFPRMNLHTIEIKHYNYLPKDYHEPLQQIISKALNLKRLKIIDDNFYPDLSNNNKLKYLCQDGRFKWYNERKNCNPKMLSRMLDQVKNSLEILKLKTAGFPVRNPNLQEFILPAMPFLKKFVVLDVTLHPLEQNGSSFLKTIATSFPVLKHLDVKTPYTSEVQKLFDRIMKEGQEGQLKYILNIQTLVVDRIENPFVLCFFKLCFPRLKKLDLSFAHLPYYELEDIQTHIESALSALGGLQLSHFVFRINNELHFPSLIKALNGNPGLFRGMDILEIYSPLENVDLMERFDDSFYSGLNLNNLQSMTWHDPEMKRTFYNWLEKTAKNMESVIFHGFSLLGANALELINLIREKNLPVKFQNTINTDV